MLGGLHRRIAQWQSTSIHTEEGAAFESCSAYQDSRSVVFLSHCVPNPPDKGEKIRAHYELEYLAARHPVHLLCFARHEHEMEAALALRDRCISVYVELLRPAALAAATARFCFGRSVTESFYYSRSMKDRALEISQSAACSVVFSSAMAQYAPRRKPMVLDMVDVDSEKWAAYSKCRFPGYAYGLEAKRLRNVERAAAARASRTILVTSQEEAALLAVAPGSSTQVLENGVDTRYFDPALMSPDMVPSGNYCVFVGAMDYYPNIDAAEYFARIVMPALLASDPSLEFWIVGRNPVQRVKELSELPYVRVIGTTPDVRPYIAGSRAVVAPLAIARGIQNKVIEALAMGKPVLASAAVVATFGSELPPGVIRCAFPAEYVQKLPGAVEPAFATRIRTAASARFSWTMNLRVLDDAVEQATAASRYREAQRV